MATEATQDLQQIITQQESDLQKLIISATTATKEETIQNEQTSLYKEHQQKSSLQTISNRIQFLQKLKTAQQEQSLSQDDLNALIANQQGEKISNKFWQLLESLEQLKASNLTFLTDQNPFLRGGEAFSILSDILLLYTGKKLGKILEKQSSEDNNSQKNAEPLAEIEQAIQQLKKTENKDQIYFLNLETLTPEKILFVARLQQESQIISLAKLVIYVDDILSEQLKESISPSFEITFEKYGMPLHISYQESEIHSSEKPKIIQKICEKTISQYKPLLMRFDMIIFVKNEEEANDLKENHLSLIQEKINLIDLTNPNSQFKQDDEKPIEPQKVENEEAKEAEQIAPLEVAQPVQELGDQQIQPVPEEVQVQIQPVAIQEVVQHPDAQNAQLEVIQPIEQEQIQQVPAVENILPVNDQQVENQPNVVEVEVLPGQVAENIQPAQELPEQDPKEAEQILPVQEIENIKPAEQAAQNVHLQAEQIQQAPLVENILPADQQPAQNQLNVVEVQQILPVHEVENVIPAGQQPAEIPQVQAEQIQQAPLVENVIPADHQPAEIQPNGVNQDQPIPVGENANPAQPQPAENQANVAENNVQVPAEVPAPALVPVPDPVPDPAALEQQRIAEEQRIAAERIRLQEQREARQAIPFQGIIEINEEEEKEKLKQENERKSLQVQQYKKNEFNIFIVKNYAQLKPCNLKKVLIQFDTGEAEKVQYFDSRLQSIPTVSLKITKEESIKRERIMGEAIAGEIHRLFTRKEFVRLQKRDSLNLFNLEAQKEYKEIIGESNQDKQSIRGLLHLLMNQSENWFSCSSEAGAHVSLLWSRMGDVHSLFNCITQISDANDPLVKRDSPTEELLQKNQVSPVQFNTLLLKLLDLQKQLGFSQNPIQTLKQLDPSTFSELLQQIVIEKYYSNLCVYTGHRRHGFRHFESGQTLNYSDLCSMRLIQERPFLLLPIQLSMGFKNQHEIKQCIAIDHSFLLENAPQNFIEKHKLRLLKRQSLNLHEMEYFGISNSLFTYFEKHSNLIQTMENELDCYYEPNIYMDTITIHCDAMHKERIEKRFKDLMDTAQKELLEEVLDFPNGKNSITRIEKGGMIKEIIILENEHEFIIEGLPLDTSEKELIDLCSEYGEAVKVTLTKKEGGTVQAEILVTETEDGAFFVEMFDKTDFRGNLITARLKSHQYKLFSLEDTTKLYNIFRWQTWKSKQTAKIEFEDQQSTQTFLKKLEEKFTIDGKEVQGTVEKENPKRISLKNLQKYTDEISIEESIPEELKKKIKFVIVERIPDVDRGISTASLTFLLKRIYSINKINIAWIKKREDGIVEAKVVNNDSYQLSQARQFDQKPNLLGQGKLYVKQWYTHKFTYDLKMKEILHIILSGNEQLVQMQQKEEIVLKFKVIRPMPSKEQYLMKLKCFNEDIFSQAKEIINLLLASQKLNLRTIKVDLSTLFDEEDIVDYSQIFSDIGLKKLKELENKYPVYFKINLLKEDIRAYCTNATFSIINKEIEYWLRQSIRIKIPISGKNIRNILGFDGKGLEQLKQKFQVCKIQLNCVSKDVFMEGNPKQIESAKNALLALLEENNSSSFLNSTPYSTEDCMVCADTIVTGYRLQGCSHKFCHSCVMFIVENSLGDINSLPIKCPFCSQQFVIKDLQALMSEDQMQKLLRMSLNNYVQKHFEEVKFCVNDNCRSVHSSKLSKYTCYECKKTYCSKCAVEYHFGLSCTLYQETEAKNVEYLIKEGARKCPKCGVYIIRFDGCYRVECRRCNSHICWKDNCMKYYDNSSDCYNHLDEKHGGYW